MCAVYVHVSVFFWYVYILNTTSHDLEIFHACGTACWFCATVGFHSTIFPNHRSGQDYWLPSPFNYRAFFDIFLCVPSYLSAFPIQSVRVLSQRSLKWSQHTLLHLDLFTSKAFYHPSPISVPRFLLYSQFLCSVYTYFLNILSLTFISLKSFINKVLSLIRFFWCLPPVPRFLSVVSHFSPFHP